MSGKYGDHSGPYMNDKRNYTGLQMAKVAARGECRTFYFYSLVCLYLCNSVTRLTPARIFQSSLTV